MPVMPSLFEACRIALGTVESNTIFVELCLYSSQFVNLRLDPNVVNVCRL